MKLGSPKAVEAATAPVLRMVHSTTYEDVYRRDYVDLVRVARLLTRSAEAAEDIVQDAFVKLYPGFDSVADPSGYLYRSVVNGCWSRHRRSRVVARLRHLVERDDVAVDEIDETRGVLRRLSPRQREIVVLRYYADLPLGDIADILGISTGTVKSTLHQALAVLREVVDP